MQACITKGTQWTETLAGLAETRRGAEARSLRDEGPHLVGRPLVLGHALCVLAALRG